MASTKEIKRRIKLVKTTSQITRAMELVAATKMRRAESDAKATRPYAQHAMRLLKNLMKHVEGNLHKLLQENASGKVLAIVITPDRGLCGALATNVLREAVGALSEFPKEEIEITSIGKRGQDFFRKRGFTLVATGTKLDWKPKIFDIRAFAKIAIDGYAEGKYQKVMLVFSNYVSTSSQKPTAVKLLPFSSTEAEKVENAVGVQTFSPQIGTHTSYLYLVEPSPEVVLNTVIQNLVEVTIYQALLESNASEHSARMVAMHSATENAKDLGADLTLSFNQIRQEGITRELAEISAGAGV